MKKLTIFSAIMTLTIIILLILIYILKPIIIDYLINNKYYHLASTLYTQQETLSKINEKNYIEINKNNLNDSYFQEELISKNITMNTYEEEILTKENNTNYKLINIEISGYKSYLVAIYDPSKVKLISSKGFNQNNTSQQTVKEICKRYKASVCINGGGFVDYGTGSDIPLGYVIEDGKIIWKESEPSNLVGLNNNNELVLLKATGEEAIKQKIRDALEFGPFLISEGNILVDKNETVGGFSKASRVAIAQRKDGIILFLVTDGMHSAGPTVYEIAQVLKQYGAYTASNLDGGASSSLVIDNKLINNPTNIYGQPVNNGFGRRVVTGFALVE